MLLPLHQRTRRIQARLRAQAVSIVAVKTVTLSRGHELRCKSGVAKSDSTFSAPMHRCISWHAPTELRPPSCVLLFID